MVREVKSDIEQSVEDHESIGSLTGDPRWIALQKVIDERIDALLALEGIIDPKDSVTDVGFRFLITRAVIAQLKSISNLPSEIHESTKLEQSRDAE